MSVINKVCGKCRNSFDISMFSKDRSKKDGLRNYCKPCDSNSRMTYHRENRDRILPKQKRRNDDNKEYRRAYYERNKEKLLDESRKRYRKNKGKFIERNRIYCATRRLNDPKYRLLMNLRTRLSYLFRKAKTKKLYKSEQLVGCKYSFLVKYIESQFDKYMNWDNYGSYWEIDHIIPCSYFDISIEEEQKRCFHYTNLKPMKSQENHKKIDKLPNGELGRNAKSQLHQY